MQLWKFCRRRWSYRHARPKGEQLIDEEGNPEAQAARVRDRRRLLRLPVRLHVRRGTNEDDTAMEKNGVTLLIDPMSYQYLVGAEIDYSEGVEGAQFVIKNPNATITCGCGSSFSA